MTRIQPLVERTDLNPAQQAVFDDILRTRGRVGGPFAVLLHRPELAAATATLGGHLRFGSDLRPAVREAVILTTATVLDCDHERLTHRRLAVEAGLDPSTVSQIDERRFDEIGGQIGIAVEVAAALLFHHRIDDELFGRARSLWTDEMLVDVIAIVGYYSFIACVLNAVDSDPGRGDEQAG